MAVENQNRENKPERITAKMLYEVLLEEYETLNILGEAEIEKLRTTQKRLANEVDWSDLDSAGAFRFTMLREIRRAIHRSQAPTFYKVFDKYRNHFADKQEIFDKETLFVAANLAAIKELSTGETTESDEDSIKIYDQAVIMVAKSITGQNELRTEIAKFKQKENTEEIAALCFSGGGIRSATFGLGVLQSLAKQNLLGKFHYLSTVSGGGYIGSWFSAWIHRAGLNTVQKQLRGEGLEVDEVEAAEIAHLRKYSNYMSPRTGMFTTDSWVLIAVYLRNLLLNWMVLVPMMAAFLLLPKLLVSALELISENRFPISLSNFQIILEFTPFLGLIGICFINMLRPSLRNYTFFKQNYRTDEIGVVKSSQIVSLFVVFPLLLFAMGLVIYWFWKGQIIPFILSDWFRYVVIAFDTNILRQIDLASIQWQNPIRNFFVNRPRLADFICFSAGLSLGGYFLSWGIMLAKFIPYWRNLKKAGDSKARITDKRAGFLWKVWNWIKRKYTTYISESILLIISSVIGGALLDLIAENINPQRSRVELFVCFGVPLFIAVFLLTATFFTGLAVRITNDDDREWMARFGGVLLKISVGWIVISSAVVFGPKLFDRTIYDQEWSPYIKAGGAIFSIIAGLFSVLAGFSKKTPASKDEPAKDWTSYLLPIASSILAPVFLLFLFICIAFLTQSLVRLSGISHTAWFVILALVAGVFGAFININKFSFHATYRERLIRAYLGASNKERFEHANSFTDLNTENDNIEMKDLPRKPFHVLNMTLNLVKPSNLAWQNRKAQSFTATPLYCGSSNMGRGSGNYRSSESYGYNRQNDKAITLGTSLAISGAAASPNMGYFTQSSAVSFLMVLLNIRLGWWLGNPGRRGNPTFFKSATPSWNKAAPSWSPKTFIAEALGLTDDTHKYIYLADGGQFENLGLYEMVLRRCKTIVLCDGGSDPHFEFFDLGSAIHKIRVDMGIPIKFESNPRKGRNCAIGTIRYSAVDGAEADDGILIYIKPTLDENQPIDIVQYHSVNPAFPHEGTLDQFYSETQFESYRKLGFRMMESVATFNGHKPKTLSELAIAADEYVYAGKK